LDAAAGVTTNASGQVSLWTDQSGNSNNASQGTTANQPVWLGNALNSRPVLRFDGTNGQMVLPGYFVSNNFSLFVVARSIAGHEVDVEGNASGYNTGGSGQRYLFGGVVNFNSFGEVGVSIGTNGLSVYEYGRNQIGSDHFAPLAVYEGPVGTNFNLIALTYTNHYPTLQKNGASVRAGLSSSRSDSVFTKTIGLGVNGSGFSGDVAEIMIYDRSLSLDEQAQLIGYLNDKYRLYAIPAAPATVSASALSPAQVMVSWHQNATNTIRSGVLERRLGAGSYVALAALENRSTYLDTNTTAATQYTYRLRARNQAGVEEYSSEASVITPATGPDLPVANLKLWLQAGSQHEIEHAGSWQDLTGSTNFAYQGTSTNRPAVIFGGINGWPVLRFDGTNDQLVLQNYFVSNNFAVFAVARTDQGHEIDAESNAQQNNTGYTGQRYLFGGVINFNDFGEAGLSVGTNGFSAYEYARNGIGSDFFSPLAVYAGSLGTNFNLLTLSYSNQQPSLYLNSALVRTGLVSPRSGSVFTKTMGFGTTGYGNSPFVGDVAEILVFDRQLTVAEQGLVSRYLNDKYACVPPSSAPIQLAARTLSPTQIGLSWRQTQTNALTSYLIERRLGTNGTFNAVAQVGSDWRFIDPGLTPQTLYSYRVRNVLNNSTNAYSNEAQAQTLTAGADFPLASAAIWLRAEDIGLIDGAAVASWPDFWQPTQAAVQTNATDQPTLAATGLNGRAAVRFSGGKYFVLPSVLSNASAAEIFVVLTSITNAPAANQGLWKFNTNGPSYYPAVGGGVQDAFGSTNSRSLLAPLPDLTVASIYNVAADTNLWRARLNGPVKQLLTTNTVSFGGTPWLGRSAQGASEPFAGFVSEIIAFNRVLTLDEQKTVRDSLAQRFGVTTELPHIPSNLTLTRTNSVDYRMSWTALVGSENGLECYFVVERQPDTNTAFLPLQTLNRTNSLYIDNTELPEISYAFRFVVVNDVGVVFSSSLAAALTDTDGDGVPDYLEIILGTNPNSSDTDGDGLPDGWELKYGLNPRSSTGRDGASGDFDNDGITNLQEYQQGTSPADGVVGDNPLIRLRVYRPK